MAQKGIWRAGTETPDGLAGHPVSPQAYERTVDGLKNAYAEQGAADLLDRRRLLRRRQDARRGVPRVHQDRGRTPAFPNADILRAMTINGYKVSETEKTRGPIKAGLLRRPHRRARQSARGHRRAEERAVRDEGRPGVQEGRRDDAGGVLPRRAGERLENLDEPRKCARRSTNRSIPSSMSSVQHIWRWQRYCERQRFPGAAKWLQMQATKSACTA